MRSGSRSIVVAILVVVAASVVVAVTSDHLGVHPLSSFAGTVLTSFWGYLGILVLFLIGVSWGGNRGGVFALVLLPVAVLLTGWIDPHAADTVCDWLASGPVDQAARILRGSAATWGTAGWGVLLSGAVIGVAAAGAVRRLLQANGLLALGADLQRRGAGGVDDPQTFMSRQVDGWAYACGIFVFFGGYFVQPILMWVALQRVAGDGALPFRALGMPDLAKPQFWPVWDASYFLVALATAVIALILGRLYRRYGMQAKMPIAGSPAWQAVAPFIGALFVPGGVMLMGAAAILVTTVELPLAAAGLRDQLAGLALALEPLGASVRFGPGGTAAPAGAAAGVSQADSISNLLWLTSALSGGVKEAGPEEIQVPPEETQPQGPQAEEPRPREPGPRPESVAGAEGTPPGAGGRPKPAGAGVIMETGRPLVDAIVFGDGADMEIVTLGEDGSLTRWRDGVTVARSTIPVSRPLGLAAAAAGRLFVVEGEGRIVDLSLESGGHEIVHSCAPGPIVCFAGHPHGNHVAFASTGEPGVRLFAAAAERVDRLVAEPPETRALAFALNGRYLTAGDAAGRLACVDALRRSVEPLPECGAAGAALWLAPAPANGWVAAFDDAALAVWDGRRELAATAAAGMAVTALTAHREDGRIAAGGPDGGVRVWSADLAAVLFDERLHEGAVKRVHFAGELLVSAGADGGVVAIRV